MRIKRTVSYNQIKRKILTRINFVKPDVSVKWEKDLCFPVKHRLYINDQITTFFFTVDTVNDLLQVSKATDDPYEFVIDSLYYSVLAEIGRIKQNGKP